MVILEAAHTSTRRSSSALRSSILKHYATLVDESLEPRIEEI